jgi:hypothetical protein
MRYKARKRDGPMSKGFLLVFLPFKALFNNSQEEVQTFCSLRLSVLVLFGTVFPFQSNLQMKLSQSQTLFEYHSTSQVSKIED